MNNVISVSSKCVLNLEFKTKPWNVFIDEYAFQQIILKLYWFTETEKFKKNWDTLPEIYKPIIEIARTHRIVSNSHSFPFIEMIIVLKNKIQLTWNYSCMNSKFEPIQQKSATNQAMRHWSSKQMEPATKVGFPERPY